MASHMYPRGDTLWVNWGGRKSPRLQASARPHSPLEWMISVNCPTKGDYPNGIQLSADGKLFINLWAGSRVQARSLHG